MGNSTSSNDQKIIKECKAVIDRLDQIDADFSKRGKKISEFDLDKINEMSDKDRETLQMLFEDGLDESYKAKNFIRKQNALFREKLNELADNPEDNGFAIHAYLTLFPALMNAYIELDELLGIFEDSLDMFYDMDSHKGFFDDETDYDEDDEFEDDEDDDDEDDFGAFEETDSDIPDSPLSKEQLEAMKIDRDNKLEETKVLIAAYEALKQKRNGKLSHTGEMTLENLKQDLAFLNAEEAPFFTNGTSSQKH